MTNNPIEFIYINVIHAIMQIYSNSPYAASTVPLSLSFSPLSTTRFLDRSITRTKVQKLSVVFGGEGISSFSGVLLKSWQNRGEEDGEGGVKMQVFFRAWRRLDRTEWNKRTAGVEIMTLNATRNFAGAA